MRDAVSNYGRLPYRLGVDIGGTFTDVVLVLPDGSMTTRKVPSTPADYSQAILECVTHLLREHLPEGESISEIVHGTTVATNAILEYAGARTALLTTSGFRDVLELRRVRAPELYNPFYRPPAPLVERMLRLEITERTAANGEELVAVDEASVERALERLRRHNVEAVAVCFLHSYRNADHERRVGELVRHGLPEVFISLSVDILPEVREYERTSTTVINAYVGPGVKRYLQALQRRLARLDEFGALPSMSIDVLIHGGRVADGSGSPPFAADLLVDRGSIVDVGHFDRVEAQHTIDASVQLVLPGFVDIHSHSDFTLLV